VTGFLCGADVPQDPHRLHRGVSGYGVALQIAVFAITFGLVHAIWGLFAGKVRAAMSAMIPTSALGGLLALDYIVGNRSLAPGAAARIGINVILEPWLIRTSASGSWGQRSIPSAWGRANELTNGRWC
jgi:hypothetical protein